MPPLDPSLTPSPKQFLSKTGRLSSLWRKLASSLGYSGGSLMDCKSLALFCFCPCISEAADEQEKRGIAWLPRDVNHAEPTWLEGCSDLRDLQCPRNLWFLRRYFLMEINTIVVLCKAGNLPGHPTVAVVVVVESKTATSYDPFADLLYKLQGAWRHDTWKGECCMPRLLGWTWLFIMALWVESLGCTYCFLGSVRFFFTRWQECWHHVTCWHVHKIGNTLEG